MIRLRLASRLAAPPDEVWAVVSTLDGVNAELGPLLRMTRPQGFDGRLRAGHLGRSWLLFGGIVPIDYDDLTIAELLPRGFRERSTMAAARAWHHDRTVERLPGGGCLVVDEVAFLPRVPGTAGLQAFLVEAVFRRRHLRLRRRFGTA